jgi:nitrite reductase/ring-hydroxylating ferredoxin subunit
VNVSALLLMLIAWFIRGPVTPSPFPVLLLELCAVVLIAAGGWMGGVLVSRNQISVDHRYARAGKWREVTVSRGSAAAAIVAQTGELEVNQMKLVHADARRIVLARDERGYAAFDDRCPHRGGSLAGGAMICGTVQCPWHGSQFDVRTGAVKAGPAERGIGTFDVSEANGRIVLSS